MYGNGLQIRDWIFVEDHCTALDLVLKKGKVGETYLVSSRSEKRNIDVVKEILGMLDLQEELIEYIEDRPGHDVRYSINPKKIEEKLGWKPKHNFSDALRFTVEHYVKNVGKYRKRYAK